MSKYQRKPEIVEATQWLKMGDHPAVVEIPVFFRSYNRDGKSGFVNGDYPLFVRPGSWIVTDSTGIHVMSDTKFREMYEVME
jgi:hypothetical protein